MPALGMKAQLFINDIVGGDSNLVNLCCIVHVCADTATTRLVVDSEAVRGSCLSVVSITLRIMYTRSVDRPRQAFRSPNCVICAQ